MRDLRPQTESESGIWLVFETDWFPDVMHTNDLGLMLNVDSNIIQSYLGNDRTTGPQNFLVSKHQLPF